MIVTAENQQLVRFDQAGLVPAIVQDARTKQVLMLAYMNAESLSRTLTDGLACFWSRSRRELWVKGATSGNYLRVLDVQADCDADTLLVAVTPDGPACHTGTTSCFDVTEENVRAETADK